MLNYTRQIGSSKHNLRGSLLGADQNKAATDLHGFTRISKEGQPGIAADFADFR
jgi:hypothetical protein